MYGFVKKNKETMMLSAIILAHAMLLFQFCDFDKIMASYIDELLYYDLAKSISYGQKLRVHGILFPFQNLAYCYFLAPFFNISDSSLRIHVITLANSLLLSLCAIPVWLICKELGLRKKNRWLAVLLIMVWPDMLTAGTLMSENLYWFVMLTAIYVCIKSVFYHKKHDSIMSAVLCYLVYFCKEVGVCLAFTYVAFMILYPFIDKIFRTNILEWHFKRSVKGIGKALSSCFKETDWMNTGIFIITYAVCYILVKKVIFRDVGNLYSSALDLSFLDGLYHRMYFVYGVLYFMVAVVLTFMILPVLYPLLYYKEISVKARKAFLFCMIFLLGTIIVIVFTITIKEDLGKVVPRVHLRYLAPVIGLLLPVFFKTVSDIGEKAEYVKKSKRNTVFFLAIFWLLWFFLFKGAAGGCVSENLGLQYAHFISDRFHQLSIETEQSVVFYLSSMVMNVIAGIILIIWGIVWFSEKRKKWFLPVVSFTIFAICTGNFLYGTMSLHYFYQADPAAIQEMSRINAYFKDNGFEKRNVMFVCQNSFGKDAGVYDTYFDGVNCYEILYETLMDQTYGQQNRISEMDFRDAMLGRDYKLDAIDYLITGDQINGLDRMIAGLELIPEISGDFYCVYKNIDPWNLSFVSETAITGNTEQIKRMRG